MRLFFFLLCIAITLPGQAQQPPNIIVVLSDDMGYSDLGCFGSEIQTPNLDQLAGQGLRFTNFYNTSRCSPTRAALLTGLYPHQAEMGWLSPATYTQTGYTGDLSKNAVTLAEVLKTAGYATYMTGKWHIANVQNDQGSKSSWPCQRGFDQFFGTLGGSGSYYTPGQLLRNNTFIAPGNDFYYTDAISDTTAKFIREHPAGKPFFIYVAYTAPHWPLHAPEASIQKYAGVYDIGWDAIRAKRFEQLKKMRIIKKSAKLSQRSADIVAWTDEVDKTWQVRRMQTYAAMIDIMDQGIGRIIDALEQRGALENTVIFYLQDNGASAEPQGSDQPEVQPSPAQNRSIPFPTDIPFLGKRPEYAPDGRFIRSGKGVMPGDPATWTAYGREWAQVSNTPFQQYKHWTHEGGIASPLIVHWPKGIKNKGALRHQPAHLVDIMATCLAISKATYPKSYQGNMIQPMEGISLMPVFQNKALNRDCIFWEHEGNRALRVGDWKLVSKTKQFRVFTPQDEHTWELYHLKRDRTETHNRAAEFPKKVQEMAKRWEYEAWRTKAKPWPW